MSSTAVLVHTSSRALDNAAAIARVASAQRRKAARIVAERHAATHAAQVRESAAAWVEDIRAAGAVKVGFKICLTYGGKWRPQFPIDGAAEVLATEVLDHADVEAWGIDANGEHVGEGW